MNKEEFNKKVKSTPSIHYNDLEKWEKNFFDEAQIEYEKQFTGRVSLRIPKQLHSIITKKAKQQGVSLNQWISYQLALCSEK